MKFQALCDALAVKFNSELLMAFWAGCFYKFFAIAQPFQFEVFVDFLHRFKSPGRAPRPDQGTHQIRMVYGLVGRDYTLVFLIFLFTSSRVGLLTHRDALRSISALVCARSGWRVFFVA